MNEEERKAVEILNTFELRRKTKNYKEISLEDSQSVEILLNLLGKLLKENKYMHNELDKQQTIINKYAKENELLRKDIEGWKKYCEEIEEEQTEMSNKNCELEFEVEKLQKENEELKEKENKIYKEVQESLAFEKFLIVKERKPDLFNQGRFYISQIIYDILNDVQNPEGIHKENKCIQYIDYIPVQRVKDNIEKEIKYHKRNILEIENITMLKSKTAKEEAEIEFNKYAIVVLKKILQELIEESGEK